MAGFKTGILSGALLVAIPVGWFVYEFEEQPIMFSAGFVSVEKDYVSVTGSVVGSEPKEEDRPMNGGISLTCFRSNGFCDYAHIAEIAPRQVSNIEIEKLQVRRWTEDELLADSLDLSSAFHGCTYYEIRVLLKSKEALYNRLPNPKADMESCKASIANYQATRQWRIASGKGWGDYKRGR